MSPVDLHLAARGFLIGLAVAAPIGPIGILCIRRTLASGLLVGFLSGLGAATADSFYAGVAALGINALSDALLAQLWWARFAGGAFLILLGARTFFAMPSKQSRAQTTVVTAAAAYVSTLLLTLTNPTTILSFAAILANASVMPRPNVHPGMQILVAGVFLGSAAWWLILSAGVSSLRARFDDTWLRWVNRVAGTVIAAFGLATLGVF